MKDIKTIEQRAIDFAIEKCCTECERNSECRNNKSAKCGLVLRYDVMYEQIAAEQAAITKSEIIERTCTLLGATLSKGMINLIKTTLEEQL